MEVNKDQKMKMVDSPKYQAYKKRVVAALEKDGDLSHLRCKKRNTRVWFRPSRVVLCGGVATALVFITGALGIGSNSANALGFPAVGYLIGDHGTYTSLMIQQDETKEYPKTLEEYYIPTTVADGYQEIERVESEKRLSVKYQNQQGNTYWFKQCQSSSMISIDSESGSFEKDTFLLGDVYTKQDDRQNVIYWSYGGYVFYMSGDISIDEMLDIAVTITKHIE